CVAHASRYDSSLFMYTNLVIFFFFFFFQAEDGIRDRNVTGVQTCALPISSDPDNHVAIVSGRDAGTMEKWFGYLPITLVAEHGRSEERRVGKECRSRWWREG